MKVIVLILLLIFNGNVCLAYEFQNPIDKFKTVWNTPKEVQQEVKEEVNTYNEAKEGLKDTKEALTGFLKWFERSKHVANKIFLVLIITVPMIFILGRPFNYIMAYTVMLICALHIYNG